MSDDGSLDPHYVSEAGAKVANGTYISCACADLTAQAAAGTVRQGVQEAGQVPRRYLLRRGLRRHQRHHPGDEGPRDQGHAAGIVSGLHKVTYKGLTKTVHFQSNGNIAGTAVYVYKCEERQDRVSGLAP